MLTLIQGCETRLYSYLGGVVACKKPSQTMYSVQEATVLLPNDETSDWNVLGRSIEEHTLPVC
jgi:hypothetical protein